MANGGGGGNRSGEFTPQHLSVTPEVRRILRDRVKCIKHTLEFLGEDFGGAISFRVPIDSFLTPDILTVAAELAAEDLGVQAEVDRWSIRWTADDVVDFTPCDFTLQEEDRGELDPVSRQEFIDMVRPTGGW